MTIKAGLAILDHIEWVLAETLNESIEFFPTDEGDSDRHSFATYSLVQNVDYEQPYIHIDILKLKFFHANKLKSQQIISKLLKDLNVENMHTNPILFLEGIEAGVKLHDVIFVVRNDQHNEFIDATTYFSIDADIIFTYVETVDTDWRRKPAYIQGV